MPMRKPRSPRHRAQVLFGSGPKTVPQRVQVAVFAPLVCGLRSRRSKVRILPGALGTRVRPSNWAQGWPTRAHALTPHFRRSGYQPNRPVVGSRATIESMSADGAAQNEPIAMLHAVDRKGRTIDLAPAWPFLDRVLREWHPEQIQLFGSRARGDANPDSDWDILVV